MLYLRIICFVLWLVAAFVFAPAFVRYLRGREFTDIDEYRAALFFTALLMIGSLGRWIFAPDNQSLFAGLYALTAALGAYVLMLARQGRRK